MGCGCGNGNILKLVRQLQRQVDTCCGQSSSSGIQFEPQNVVFVAKSWPAGADPAVFFTTIQAAVDKADTLSPAQDNQILVWIAPGYYNEAVVMPASQWIGLFAMSGPQASDQTQTVSCNSVTYNQGGPWGISGIECDLNVTSTTVYVRGCEIGTLTQSGGSVQVCGDSGVDSLTETDGGYFQILGGFLGTSNVNGSIIAPMGCDVFGTVNLVSAAMQVNSGGIGTVPCYGNVFEGDINADVNSTADIRGSEYKGALNGPGAINRSYDKVALTTSNATGVVKTWASLGLAPYINAPDEITWMQQSGTAGLPLFPTITDTQFTYTDGAARVGVIGIHMR